MREIVEGVYRIALWFGYLNIYVIDTCEGLAVVDTGVSQDSVDAIVRGIASIGRKMDDVRYILITHAHFDHTGGLKMLQKQTDATTYAHRREAMVIHGERDVVYAQRKNLRGLAWLMHPFLAPNAGEPARVDVELHDADAVTGGMVALELTGHTLGQVGYWWPERRILFGGDVMFSYPWGLRMPLAAASPDWQAAKEAIRRVARLDVATLCLGHGAPIPHDAAPQIKALATRMDM